MQAIVTLFDGFLDCICNPYVQFPNFHLRTHTHEYFFIFIFQCIFFIIVISLTSTSALCARLGSDILRTTHLNQKVLLEWHTAASKCYEMPLCWETVINFLYSFSKINFHCLSVFTVTVLCYLHIIENIQYVQ